MNSLFSKLNFLNPLVKIFLILLLLIPSKFFAIELNFSLILRASIKSYELIGLSPQTEIKKSNDLL